MNTRQKLLLFGKRGGAPAPAFDSDYQAVLNYATAQGYTLPSAAQQTAQNQLVLDLKAAGVWAKFKELHIWRTGQVGQSDFKSIDWKRLNTASYVNAPTLATDGIEGDGVSSYVDLNFNCSTETTQNDMTFGFWANNGGTPGVNVSQMGALEGNSNGTLHIERDNNSYIFACNSDILLPSFSIANNTGLQCQTTDGSILEFSRNAVSAFTGAITPNAANISVFALCRSANGTPTQFSDDTLSITFHSDGLTLAQLASMKTILETYYTAIA